VLFETLSARDRASLEPYEREHGTLADRSCIPFYGVIELTGRVHDQVINETFIVLLTHGRPSECLVWRSCGQPREIPVSLPLVVHSLIRQTFRAVFEYPSQRFWPALRPTNSPWALPLWQRRPHYLVGFWPWSLPWRVKPGFTVGEIYRGPLPFNCLPLPWRQLRTKCPPLPQPQHTVHRLSSTAAGDPQSRSTVNCWRSCLISANSSQTKLVVKLVSSSAAAVATCTAVFAGDVDTSSSAPTCCIVGMHCRLENRPFQA